MVNNLDSSLVIDLDSSINVDNNVNTIDTISNTVMNHGDTIQISSCFSSIEEEVPSKKRFLIFLYLIII